MIIQPRTPRLVIIEMKNLTTDGHFYTQIPALQSLFPDYETHLVTNQNYDGWLGAATALVMRRELRNARYHFDLQYAKIPRRLQAILKLIARRKLFSRQKTAYAMHLMKIHSELNLCASDLVIVPTANFIDICSLIRFAKYLSDDAPKLVLRILDPKVGINSEQVKKRFVNAVCDQLPRQIKLFTETEEMAAHINKRCFLEVEGGFYMPGAVSRVKIDALSSPSDDKIRIGVFGSPRAEKGSHLIVPIIRELVKRVGADSKCKIEFLIQGAESDFCKGGPFEEIDFVLEGQNQVTYRHLPISMNTEKYEAMFGRAQIILLPYDKDVYDLRGSGVVQDALMSKQAIVYSKGMAMQRFLSFGNAFSATSASEFADAIQNVINSPEEIRHATETALVSYTEHIKNHPLVMFMKS